MDFRTQIKSLQGLTGTIRHGQPMLMIGSCFTDNIGRCLENELFDVVVNPFGPIYNPLSILRAIRILAEDYNVHPDSLFEHEGRYHSFLFHSRYSGADSAESVCEKMNESIRIASDCLRKCDNVIITFGTTQVYALSSSGEVVANCHKLPQSQFLSYNLTLNETIKAIESIYRAIRSVNLKAKIVFTVSPLRYLGDGAHANQLIKATLLLAVEEIITQYPGEIIYFPAYEIMMDDLRDYRFYAEDMRHPSDMAVKYIYDNFRDSFFDETTLSVASEASKITRRMAHKPFSGAISESDLKFKENIDKLISVHPELIAAYKRYKVNGI